MPRYGLNLRPIYDPNEPTGYDILNRGISGAFGRYFQNQEADRQEANTVRQQGGVAIPQAPQDNSIGGRFRRAKSSIADFLGRGSQQGSQQGTDYGTTATGAQRDGVIPGSPPSPPYTDVGGFTRPVPDMSRIGSAGGAGTFMPQQPGPAHAGHTAMDENPADYGLPNYGVRGKDGFRLYPGTPHPAPPPTGGTPIPPGARTPNGMGIGPMLAQGTGDAGPGDDTSYEYQTRSGQRYRVDPLRNQRAEMAMKTNTSRAEQEREIAALTDAGMPASEARARVLTNTVRYDTEFGQQFRPGGASGGAAMTQAERLQIQDRLDRRQRMVIASQELRAAQASGDRSAAMRLQRELAVLRADEAAANRAEGAVDRATIDPVVSNTQSGKAAIGGMRTRAEELRARADSARSAVASPRMPGVSGGSSSTSGGGAKRTVTQAQYDAARAKGYTDAQIAAAYNIDPSVRRKR